MCNVSFLSWRSITLSAKEHKREIWKNILATQNLHFWVTYSLLIYYEIILSLYILNVNIMLEANNKKTGNLWNIKLFYSRLKYHTPVLYVILKQL